MRGNIIPAIPQTNISIQYLDPNAYSINTTVTTDTQGEFRDLFTPNSSGLWTISAMWLGNSEYDGTINITQLLITEIPHTITLSPISGIIGLNEPVSLNGTLLPSNILDPTITITVQDPLGNSSTLHMPINASGSFNYLLTPTTEGTWSATATWYGTGLHLTATSPTISFDVSGGVLSWVVGHWYFIAPVGIVPVIIVVIQRRRGEE